MTSEFSESAGPALSFFDAGDALALLVAATAALVCHELIKEPLQYGEPRGL